MRISDWSSDVCSSDLLGGDIGIDEDAVAELAGDLFFQFRDGAAFGIDGAGQRNGDRPGVADEVFLAQLLMPDDLQPQAGASPKLVGARYGSAELRQRREGSGTPQQPQANTHPRTNSPPGFPTHTP